MKGCVDLFYAHSTDSASKDSWQLLKTHLVNTAELARCFAEEFGLGEVAYVQGLLHDAGKYSMRFQHKLDGQKERVDHATVGAKIACEKYKGIGKMMAYGICGHHGGLPNGIDAGLSSKRSSLNARLQLETDEIEAFWDELILPDTLDKRFELKNTNSLVGFTLAMYIKMLYSALVDADFLDTAAFYSPESSELRDGFLQLDCLISLFFEKLQQLQEQAADTPVNRNRKIVYEDCLRAADLPQGIYTLTVPTGGGKTLSSMAFSLNHAKKHGLKRIIYAIPFTSIIEQNADVLRRMLGDKAVLEHHSNYDFKDDDELSRLAAENWNAPVIVTTNVQLFESLFSNKPSSCRKLHSLANSVIILDEAQTIPDDLLKPCLAALQCLSTYFGTTVVICTATQPALESQWPDNIETREIIKEPLQLFEAFRKVDVQNLGTLSDEQLAENILAAEQVLCIVNTRRHAGKIFDLLPKQDSSFHLSALMCPAHRTEIIKDIRERLRNGEPCRVISTQLIEAGVDVDFPVVYRAAAGIDSIAQAAGRCNREGKLPIGKTYVFFPENGLPKGWFQRMATLGTDIINSGMDPLGMPAVKQFFLQRYRDAGINGLDKHEILRALREGQKTLDFPFEQIAQEFSFINSSGKQIVIPYDQSCREKLVEAAKSQYPWRFARFFQKYTVTVYPYELEQLIARSYLKQIGDAFIAIDTDEQSYRKIYDEKKGLIVEPEMEVLSL